MKTILLDDRESDALQVQLEHLIELMQGTHPKNERLLYRVGLHNYVHLQSVLRKLKQKEVPDVNTHLQARISLKMLQRR